MLDINLLEKLCLADGASGDETTVRNIIENEINKYADDIKKDAMGNLLVFKKGKQRAKSKLMLSAHMDEVALMLIHIGEDGYLRFAPVGGINKAILPGLRVHIGENKIQGVIGLAPIHLQKTDEKQNAIDIDKLCIDIGANSKEEAKKVVSEGDFIYFDSSFEYNDKIIKSKALDDRIGCLLLIEMIKQELEFDMYFAFLVQEEVGTRGASGAAFSIEPDCAIVVDVTTACDIPDVPKHKQVSKLSCGATLPLIDSSMVYDKDFISLAKNLAIKENIKIQFKEAASGGTDAGAIFVSKSGVKTAAVVACARYLHSACSIANIDDIENVKKMLSAISCKICNKKWS